MRDRERSYRCHVCGWQGQAEVQDVGNAAPCPHCGVYLYPQSWMQGWGVVVLMIALTTGLIVATAML